MTLLLLNLLLSGLVIGLSVATLLRGPGWRDYRSLEARVRYLERALEQVEWERAGLGPWPDDSGEQR